MTLVFTVKIYYSFILGVNIEPSVFEGMFDSNIDEAQRLGSSKPIFIFVAVITFITIIIEFNWLKSFPWKKRVLVHFFKLFIVLGLLFVYGLYNKKIDFEKLSFWVLKTFPINFVNSFYTAANARYKLYKMNNSKIDITKKYNFKIKNEDNLTVVFVRAESLRARSFPITGDDIPLSQRVDTFKNIVFYNNVFSYANYTSAAVPYMLSRSVDDELQNEKSLISVARFMGFDTTWVGCDTSNIAKFAQPIANYSLEANRSLFIGKLEEWLRTDGAKKANKILGFSKRDAKQFTYVISKINTNNYKKSFFWIELSGSHIPWQQFPNQFTHKEPLCKKSLDEIKECSQAEAENSYKSTIRYTQYLLYKMIQTLKNKNSILFFISDHGESTGENGYYGHGFLLPKDKRQIRDQVNTAFMVWVSDTFKSKHPNEYNYLQENSQKYMKHDIIFHSVLDILDIESEIIDINKSIFSNAFKGRTKQTIHQPITTIKIQQEDDQVIFTVSPLYREKYKIAFYLFNESKRVDKQWYSKNFTYKLEKKKYKKGKYRIQYFLISEDADNPGKTKKLERGYSEFIELNLDKNDTSKNIERHF